MDGLLVGRPGTYPLFAWCRVAVNATLLFEPVRFFVDAAQGEPTSGGKILLEQKQAVQQWDKLQELLLRAGADVVGDQPLHPALQTRKGIAALITQYMLKLFGGSTARSQNSSPRALTRERPKTTKSAPVLPGHSASAGKCLAQIQLQVRLYRASFRIKFSAPSWKGAQARTSKSVAPAGKLRPTLPILQTTTSLNQGFEIAVASRMPKHCKPSEEEAFLNARMTQEFLPDQKALDTFDMEDMDELLEHAPQDVWWQNPRTN